MMNESPVAKPMSLATHEIEATEAAWAAIEREQAADWGKGPTGVSRKPHPKSYRPDLPLVSTEASTNAWADGVVKTGVDRAVEKLKRAALKRDGLVGLERMRANGRLREARVAVTTIVTAGKPHPNSYRPDLPLHGFTDKQLTKATAEDEAAWAARPLMVTPNVFAVCPDCNGSGQSGRYWHCWTCDGEGALRRGSETLAVAVLERERQTTDAPVAPDDSGFGDGAAEAQHASERATHVVAPYMDGSLEAA